MNVTGCMLMEVTVPLEREHLLGSCMASENGRISYFYVFEFTFWPEGEDSFLCELFALKHAVQFLSALL